MVNRPGGLSVDPRHAGAGGLVGTTQHAEPFERGALEVGGFVVDLEAYLESLSCCYGRGGVDDDLLGEEAGGDEYEEYEECSFHYRVGVCGWVLL